jgi:hypothetical protein
MSSLLYTNSPGRGETGRTYQRYQLTLLKELRFCVMNSAQYGSDAIWGNEYYLKEANYGSVTLNWSYLVRRWRNDRSKC